LTVFLVQNEEAYKLFDGKAILIDVGIMDFHHVPRFYTKVTSGEISSARNSNTCCFTFFLDFLAQCLPECLENCDTVQFYVVLLLRRQAALEGAHISPSYSTWFEVRCCAVSSTNVQVEIDT
jgi:hypothetical protein